MKIDDIVPGTMFVWLGTQKIGFKHHIIVIGSNVISESHTELSMINDLDGFTKTTFARSEKCFPEDYWKMVKI